MFPLLMAIILVFAIAFVAFVFVYGGKQEEEGEVFEEIRNPVVLQILVPKENDKTPLAAEQMFASIHGILRDSKKSVDMIGFEIISTKEDGIRFYAVVPQHLYKFIEGQIYAQYPNAEISFVTDYTAVNGLTHLSDGSPYEPYVTTGEIVFDKQFIFPIKTFRNFEVDPLAAITGAMSDLKEGESIWLQMLTRPIANYWQDSSKKYITAIREGKDPNGSSGILDFFVGVTKFFMRGVGAEPADKGKQVVKLAPGQDEELRQIEEKMLKVGFEFIIRVVTKAPGEFESEQLLKNIIASFKQFSTAHLNNFIHTDPEKSGQEIYNDYLRRYLPAKPTDIMNIEELASVYHLPNISVETPNISWSRARKAEPPMNLPTIADRDANIFAETNYRGEKIEFGIKTEDRRKHFYLLGKTGVGKSTVFKNLFIADVLRGDGACFVDPHGDTVEELLEYIPENRIDDVVYFDPSDVDHPIGFNLIELKDKTQRDLVADGVVEVFKKQFDMSWGPRLQYILQNAVATALEVPGMTLLGVMRLLIDNNYRKFVLKQVQDPVLINFWQTEFAQMSQNQKLVSESIAPIQNKVGRFISSGVIRNIVGQVKSTISLEEIMNNKKILLINLSQGKLGVESCALLGGMIITRLQSTALGRVNIPFDDRKDFFLYVDEFQNFATDSFAKILSEARKYKLNLTMTNQYIDQIPLTVRQAIFGNVGSLASFVVSQADASILANEFKPIFLPEDLVSLEAHSMYVKLSIDGMSSVPFSAKSLNLRYSKYGYKDVIIARSREKYSMDRSIIEDKIGRWSNQSYSEKGNRSVVAKDGTKTPVVEMADGEEQA